MSSAASVARSRAARKLGLVHVRGFIKPDDLNDWSDMSAIGEAAVIAACGYTVEDVRKAVLK